MVHIVYTHNRLIQLARNLFVCSNFLTYVKARKKINLFIQFNILLFLLKKADLPLPMNRVENRQN